MIANFILRTLRLAAMTAFTLMVCDHMVLDGQLRAQIKQDARQLGAQLNYNIGHEVRRIFG